jgi:hypothetical protein
MPADFGLGGAVGTTAINVQSETARERMG